ncbi:MAG: HIT-like protein, partial [Nitrososphaeraceae archaeon]|nr:HIT-like protein [Nitrososphaeraceae archaeon]
MANSSCVFCSIIAGNLPKAILYEDTNILAVMDKYPINVGHTLVIPKIH